MPFFLEPDSLKVLLFADQSFNCSSKEYLCNHVLFFPLSLADKINLKKAQSIYQFKFISTVFEDHRLLVWINICLLFFFIFQISQILVRHRVSYVYSHCSNPLTNINTLGCFGGCTGSVVMHANCTESNSIDNWADFLGETIFDIKSSTPSSTPIDLRLVIHV